MPDVNPVCPFCGHHTVYKPDGWIEGGPLACANPICDSNNPTFGGPESMNSPQVIIDRLREQVREQNAEIDLLLAEVRQNRETMAGLRARIARTSAILRTIRLAGGPPNGPVDHALRSLDE